MLGDLDAAYVADAGQGVAHYVVGRGRSCELAYTPGNGTLYELVFVPIGYALDAAKDWMDNDGRRSIAEDRPEWKHDADSLLVLAWLGHGAWQVDLRDVWHDSFFAQKYADCGPADGSALRQLLLAVADASRLPVLRSVN